MRRIIFQCHFAIMGMNDGLAERKPKPKTSAAVANRIAPGKEHFKHMFLQFIGDTETVIADAYLAIFSRGIAVIRMFEPAGVYLTALFTKLISTCMMSPGIDPHQQRRISQSTVMRRSADLRSICRSASDTISSTT